MDDTVFCDHLGKRVVSLNKHLNQLLKAADILKSAAGDKYSTYCFRHSYATWQLQKANPVDVYTLAINMRTSVEMIEKYYSDVIAEDKADVLRGDPFDNHTTGSNLKFGKWIDEDLSRFSSVSLNWIGPIKENNCGASPH